MRALTMDEVESVSGGKSQKTVEVAQQANGLVDGGGIGGMLSKIISAVSDFFGAPHQYTPVSPLLLCTPDQAMQALMAPWMTAPGAPQAKDGGPNQVSLLFGNNILQVVNSSEGSIINRALPDHIFQGSVTTQVSAAYGGSQITTYGTGVAGENMAIGAFNAMVGHLYFGGRNIAVSMECDAINGVYVP
jgi:hypothetical protein